MHLSLNLFLPLNKLILHYNEHPNFNFKPANVRKITPRAGQVILRRCSIDSSINNLASGPCNLLPHNSYFSNRIYFWIRAILTWKPFENAPIQSSNLDLKAWYKTLKFSQAKIFP